MNQFTTRLAMRTITTSILGVTVGYCLSSGGCASSTASASATDANSRVGLGEFRQAAMQLSQFLATDKRIQSVRGNPDNELVVLIDKVEVQAGGGSDHRSLNYDIKSFFNAMDEACIKNNIAVAQNLRKNDPYYDPGFDLLSQIDSDARYDQTTGDITTGSAIKPTVTMQLIIEAQITPGKRGSTSEFVLRARVAHRGRTLASESYYINKG
ncbi:MAG: hypothetical protein O2855_06165 [Planctomycetota bacterium]|nr:hypothetical protein [Planctomycetota bacterium]